MNKIRNTIKFIREIPMKLFVRKQILMWELEERMDEFVNGHLKWRK